MNESLSRQGEQEARACRQMNKAVGQPFILSFISKPPIRHSHTRPGVRGSGGRGTGRGGAREATPEPRGRVRARPKGALGAWVPEPQPLLAVLTLPASNPSLHQAEPWRHRVLGPGTARAKPTLSLSDPQAHDPSLPHGSSGPGSAPSRLPFPPSCAPTEASQGHASAARPAPATSVPTGSAL